MILHLALTDIQIHAVAPAAVTLGAFPPLFFFFFVFFFSISISFSFLFYLKSMGMPDGWGAVSQPG